MPSRVLQAARFTDAQVMAFFEAVMARWPTNAPLMAVGGFSYSFPSFEWQRALQGVSTFFVTSATLSERDAAFSIVFQRSADGLLPDEIRVSWNEPDAPHTGFPAADARALGELVERLDRALEPLPALPGR